MKIAAAWWSLSGDGFWPNGSAVSYLPYWERSTPWAPEPQLAAKSERCELQAQFLIAKLI